MTPDQFRRHREAMGLSYSQFAAYLGVTPGDVIRWERYSAPERDPFIMELAIAYLQLQVEATAVRPLPPARTAQAWITSDREAPAAASA